MLLSRRVVAVGGSNLCARSVGREGRMAIRRGLEDQTLGKVNRNVRRPQLAGELEDRYVSHALLNTSQSGRGIERSGGNVAPLHSAQHPLRCRCGSAERERIT